MTTTDAPDETPRATLREDERAVAEVLCPPWHREGSAGQSIDADGNVTSWVGERRVCTMHAAQARQIAPLVAAARAEAWDEGWDEFSGRAGAVRFLDADGDVIRPNPYRAARIATGGGAE